MKKVLSIIAMFVFVAGFTMAQNPPAKKSEKAEVRKEAKGEAKPDSTKKAHAKHMGMKKGEGKKAETKK